jgi:hypothetical protein
VQEAVTAADDRSATSCTKSVADTKRLITPSSASTGIRGERRQSRW